MRARGGEGSGALGQLVSCADVPGTRVTCGRAATGVICGRAARTGGTQNELQASILASPLPVHPPQSFVPSLDMEPAMAAALAISPFGMVDRLRPRITKIPSSRTNTGRFRLRFIALRP